MPSSRRSIQYDEALRQAHPKMPKGAAIIAVSVAASASSSPAWRQCITQSRSSGSSTTLAEI